MNHKENFEALLQSCVSMGASDLHLTGDEPVSLRVHGKLRFLQGGQVCCQTVEGYAGGIMTRRQQQTYAQCNTVDLGYTAQDGERFRINCYRERGKPAMAIRHLNQRLLSLEELGLPPQLRDLAHLRSGLVLVTGATGSGKSSTLAMLLNEINHTRECHILTVEDPVEFVHASRKSLIHHREVHTDVPSYAEAMRAAMREDPDVIMLGEMRDLETMQAAITAAETGHLVFSTLHTGEAVGAVERFIGHFSGEEQAAARHRLSMVLRAVVAQRLVPKKDGQGRLPAVELLLVTTAAANLIQNSKTRQLYSLMESGARDGMWTLDQELARLVKLDLIHLEEAQRICNNFCELNKFVDVAGCYRR